MMIISHKIKHTFWSQLLVSMIAMFALPNVQGVEYSESTTENYQQQSHHFQQQLLKKVALVHQAIVPYSDVQQRHIKQVKFSKNEPHLFVSSLCEFSPPIRGSPSL
ncbi:secA translation cis-regulator SecM [Mannheimia massilioguelmaensis]|uniref:secA translation cis-regulator SecM n=1 Tax=Mannheimia massilioguelmaensis TaxID=1604354 RepID=UPI0009E393C1|nr:secA translation cis-regulator SecM [Mannheimia massilioguelmaensis]